MNSAFKVLEPILGSANLPSGTVPTESAFWTYEAALSAESAWFPRYSPDLAVALLRGSKLRESYTKYNRDDKIAGDPWKVELQRATATWNDDNE